ncbi:hypothetical protein Tco_0529901 [Tanacetum coccineum]
MDYFISVHPRSNVRFSALFLDPEEKSSFHPNDFSSMILQKIVCASHDTMTDVDVNAPAELAPTMAPPTRTDDQILPHIRWVPIGKSNCYLDVDRPQSNPIFKIAVDLLKHTNFFRAFTASSAIPAIYIQQFWDTIRYDKIAGGYKCQLDEQWFDLSKDTLRDALQITPVDRNNAFSSPPTPDALIKFVNDLGYPKVVRHLSDVVTNDMFQPWRALTTIINLCLTGKTSGFERPRAPVLQILWGVINRAHIDYAERMWEEFTQSIHTFIEDKKNLAQHTQGKKKATLIVIPSIRFTKLIIHYLQSKHKFHARPGSPLHLPNEEPALGYLKFSSKGTKREVFGMPILNDLVTDDIRGKQYYNAYLEKVAKHQRYLAGEDVSDPDSLAPKPTKGAKPKTTKKPTSTQQTKPKTKPSITNTTKSTPSQPPKPKPTPSKPQEKKRKWALEAAEAPSLAKRSKTGRVSKKRTLQLRDEFIDEGVPMTEPRIDDEEAIVQKVLEESMKDAYPSHRGPLPPVVFREPDSRKLQPLPEVQGKGKEKVGEEQVAQVLLNLQTPKKKNPAELGMESDEEVSPEMNAQGQEEGQGALASSQPNTEQMDDEFTATAYPKTRKGNRIHQLETQDVSRLIKEQIVEFIDSQEIDQKIKESVKEVVTASVQHAMRAPLRARFKDLPTSDMKEILLQRMLEENYDKGHEDHKMAYELTKVYHSCMER